MTAPDEIAGVRAVYDPSAADYDQRWRNYLEATLGAALDSIALDGGEWVLDLACGTGALEARLLDGWPGLTIVGIDLSRGMLDQARAGHRAGVVGWVQANASRLPIPDRSFDRVVCANSLHHFRTPARALLEAHRVLRPGGQFVLVDWSADFVTTRMLGYWLRWADPSHQRTWTLRACRSLLERSGFEEIETRRFKIDRLWGLMRLVGRRPASL